MSYDSDTVDLVHRFVQMAYKLYPATRYDDMLNCLARTRDEGMMLVWTKPKPPDRDIYDRPDEPAVSDSRMEG